MADTGIGSELLQRPTFRAFQYPNLSELLSQDIVHSMASSLAHHRRCLDLDDNSVDGDALGIGPEPQASRDCQLSGHNERWLSPRPSKPNATQDYHPEHGSFVSPIASGLNIHPVYENITQHVGLVFARVTRANRSSPKTSIDNRREDLRAVLQYAVSSRVDVVNLSLRTTDAGAFKPLRKNPQANIVLVTSAGNHKEMLDLARKYNLPASFDEQETIRKTMLVVGALQPDRLSPWWPSSAHSDRLVDIAAPGVAIRGLDHMGQPMCGVGTSAAAAFVTITAALLKSFGLANASTVTRRILAAADHDPRIGVGRVADARRLNVAAALDLFADRITVKRNGRPETIRGWIDTRNADFPNVLKLCEDSPDMGDLLARNGETDLYNLWYWRRVDANHGLAFHRLKGAFKQAVCRPGHGNLNITEFGTGRNLSLPWSSIERLVPSHMRKHAQTIIDVAKR